MGILSILPDLEYQNQGLDREWNKNSRYDWFWYEFIGLSEQAILNSEIFNSNTGGYDTNGIFGYQGRFDEYRYAKSTVHSRFLESPFNTWHMARGFTNGPGLNNDFITANNSERTAMKRGMASTSENAFLITYANVCPKTIRPLPWISEPGRLDHY